MPINFPIIQQRPRNDFLEGIGSGANLIGSLLESRMKSQLHPQELRRNELDNALRQFNLQSAPEQQMLERERYDQQRQLNQARLQESILNSKLKPNLNEAQIKAYESQARANDARANRYNNPISQSNLSPAREEYYKERAKQISKQSQTYAFDRLSNAEKENQVSFGVALTGLPRDEVLSDLRNGKTLEDYRNELGISKEQFNKLSPEYLPEKSILTQQQKSAAGRAGFNAIHDDITEARAPYVGSILPNGYSLKFEKESLINSPKTRDSRAKYLASKFIAGSDIANILRTEGVQAGITAIKELKDDFLLKTKTLYPQDEEVYKLANDYLVKWANKISEAEKEIQLNPGKAVRESNSKILGEKNNSLNISSDKLIEIAKKRGYSL